ncbi:hypothetical protein ATANTOWER_002546 [Ataeniobius toweri]|uniref:Uncharacterized protein n=1 Tax=Ataeniobius toweri TaxID=208326 RepID=A0ABU7CAY0_9TELE|nr:hypothetical protein [Ataeniobius toweri]
MQESSFQVLIYSGAEIPASAPGRASWYRWSCLHCNLLSHHEVTAVQSRLQPAPTSLQFILFWSGEML